jgi:predicted solute-binding protein
MSFNDVMAKALEQAKALQKQVTEAATEAAEQMKPHIEQSLEKARELQATLARQAGESSEVAAKSAEVARGHINEYIKMGSEAMRESAELTRQTTLKMVDQSKKIVDAASAAMSKKPE